jgi:protein-S-isoprenylcysteine O-methyltransferase Ste14
LHPLLRTLLFTVVVPGTMTVLIPRWLLRGAPPVWSGWHAAGAPLIAFGALLYLWCAWHLAMRGRGTPGAWDPPRRLVVSGPYRIVRNPMYVGVGSVVLGEALLFASFPVLRFFLLGAAVVFLFVLLYEEPVLRRKFGDEYREYCRNVRRWIPRLTPWRPPWDAGDAPRH